jgi:glycosyltransferase involved in cell wall biosynthesis
MKEPKITIVTVVLNAKNTIEKTIQSVINQRYLNFEYHILDGGSTDGTIEIITKYLPQISLFKSASDKGIYDAMNKSVNDIKVGWVLFLGADDIIYNENVLADVAVAMNNNRTIYYGDSLFKKRGIRYDGNFSIYKLGLRNICHQSIFYPIEVFSFFLYEEQYKLLADYAFNLKIYGSKQFQFQFIDILVSVFNDDATSANNIDYEFEKDKLQLVKKNLGFLVFIYCKLRRGLKQFLIKRTFF